MAFSHYHRFNKAQIKIANKSDSLPPVRFVQLAPLQQLSDEIHKQLSLENLEFVERSSQQLVDAICAQLDFSSALTI